MGAIDDDLQPGEVGTARHTALTEFDIAPGGIVDSRDLAQLLGLDHRHRLIKQLFDHQLNFVRQLGALPGEELDAVVMMGIVRGTDNDSGLGMESTGQVGNCWRRHRAEQHHIRAGRGQTSLQGRLEHITGDARVLADQNAALALLAKCHPGCPAELEHEFRGYREVTDTPTNTVSTKIFSTHPTIPSNLFGRFNRGDHPYHINCLRHIVHSQDVCALAQRQRSQGQTAI